MRAASMCFSILQVPKCGIYRLSSVWTEGFYSAINASGRTPSLRVFSSQGNGVEGPYIRRWTKRPASTKTGGRNRTTGSSKSAIIRHKVLKETVSANAVSNVNKTEVGEVLKVPYFNIRQMVAENKDLSKLVTVIIFDIETTGFSRENDRIIEIALQDLKGGKNSTFQALVNPECYVPNADVHGITTKMVCRSDVPRMEELIPILLHYVKSRQKPGGCVMLVAHNARSFDVPFLVNEFSRCSATIPPYWLFLDALPLGRQRMKLEGPKVSSKATLQALREMYNIPLVGNAHRALSDVNVLALVFQRLTFDLKLSLPSLIQESFTPSDLAVGKKKTSR